MRTLATRTHPGARRLGAVASLALVSVLAVGCGDDSDSGGGDGGDAGPTVLTEDQLTTAALSLENLGEGWEEDPEESDEDSVGPGCFGEIDQITKEVEPAAEVDKGYAYGDAGLPRLDSGTSSFEDEEALTSAFDQVQETLSGCTSVQGPDSDGAEWDLTLEYDDAIGTEGVDDQVNLVGSGTITTPEGQQVPLSIHLTMARIDNNVATVGTTDLSDATEAHSAYSQIAIDRLLAVVNGEEPPATTAPAPA